MAKTRRKGLWDWLLARRTQARWARHAAQAGHIDLPSLRQQRAAAQHLRPALDRVIALAETRLALPRIGATAFARPPGTDWSWRPPLWQYPLDTLADPAQAIAPANGTAIGESVKIFHDCPLAQIALRQSRNHGVEDLAPYALSMEVFAFAGSFLSLALDLPPAALAGLGTRHLVRVDLALEAEAPIGIYLRLNVQHGPNVAQLGQSLPHVIGTGARHGIEFDLGYETLNEKRIEKAWIDLIFERPQMNRVRLRDLTLARYPRAPL